MNKSVFYSVLSIRFLTRLSSQEFEPARHSFKYLAGLNTNSVSLSFGTIFRRQGDFNHRKPQDRFNCPPMQCFPVNCGFGKFRNNGKLFKLVGVLRHLAVFLNRVWSNTKGVQVILDAVRIKKGAPYLLPWQEGEWPCLISTPGAFCWSPINT